MARGYITHTYCMGMIVIILGERQGRGEDGWRNRLCEVKVSSE